MNRPGSQFVLAVLAVGISGYSLLPAFFASMNSLDKLVETILSRTNIADTNELAEAVESWRWPSGGASWPLDPRRRFQENSTHENSTQRKFHPAKIPPT